MTEPSKQKQRRVQTKVTVQELLELLAHQEYKCALTGRVLTPTNATLDHVAPRHAGGLHTIGNCQIVLSEANRAKGKMTQEEFIALCRDVVEIYGLHDGES